MLSCVVTNSVNDNVIFERNFLSNQFGEKRVMFPLMARLFCRDFRYVVTDRYHKMKIVQNENLLRIALLVFSICFGVRKIFVINISVIVVIFAFIFPD